MADVKVSALSALTTPAAADILYIVDASDTSDGPSGTSKKITYSDLTDLSTVEQSSLTITEGTTGTNALNFGDDVSLYRAAADELRTDDYFTVGSDLIVTGATPSQSFRLFKQGYKIALSGASDGAYDVNLYAQSGGYLVTDNDFVVGNGNVYFGDDCLLYRAAANVLRSPDNLSLGESLHVSDNNTATAGGAVAVKIGQLEVLGIYFGSGAPTVSAPQGSLYLRTDGSSTSTRAYINTNGSTTWTAITTAA